MNKPNSDIIAVQSKFNQVVGAIVSLEVAYFGLDRRSNENDQNKYVANLTSQLKNLENIVIGINKKEMEEQINLRAKKFEESLLPKTPESKIILARY